MKQFYLSPANIIQPIFHKNDNVFKRKPIILLDKSTRWRKCADLFNLSSKARMKLEWMIFYYAVGKENGYLTARHFGIAPKTFYKWLNRFIVSKENILILEEQSRKPHRVRQWTVTPLEEARIKELRRNHLHWGRIKLKILYQKQYKETISAWKIQRIINLWNLYPNPLKQEKLQVKRKRNGLNPKKRIQELVKQSILWYLLQLDGITIHRNGLKRYILTAIDHASKFGFARMYSNKSSTSARDFLYRLSLLINQPILNLQTDNGSEFEGAFAKAVQTFKVEHYFSRVNTPEDNSEVERFNQTLEYEWLKDGNFISDCQRFNQRLTHWLIEYNFTRPHQTLDYLAPMEYIEKEQRRRQSPDRFLLPMCPDRTGS